MLFGDTDCENDDLTTERELSGDSASENDEVTTEQIFPAMLSAIGLSFR